MTSFGLTPERQAPLFSRHGHRRPCPSYIVRSCEIMELEIINSLSEALYLGQMMIVRAIGMIITLLTLSGLIVYILGIAWFYFEEKRARVTRQRTPSNIVQIREWKRAMVVRGQPMRDRAATRRSGDTRNL